MDLPEQVEAVRAALWLERAKGRDEGVAQERARIKAALTALEREAGLEPLFVEGSPAARAVAGYVARVRQVVEGGA